MGRGKPAATRLTGLCAVCCRPCHATTCVCRRCEKALVTEVEAFLADVRPSADGGAA